MSVRTITSINKRFGVFFLLLFIAIISFVSTHTVLASGEEYLWDGPDRIIVQKGSLPTPATLTVTVSSSGAQSAVGQVVLFEDSDRICRTSIFLSIDSTSKAGSITGVKTTPGAGGGGDQTILCSESEQATIDAWPGSTISITGERGGTETSDQKKINVALLNPKAKSDSPANVKFTMKKEPNGGSRSFTSNISDDGFYYGTFANVAPGKYTICVNKLTTACETVTKIANKSVDVQLGESAESQLLRVRVVIEEGVPVETFKIDLKKNDKIIRSQSTDTPGTTDDLDFLKVEPGNYKVCYKNRCENAVKEESETLLVTLNISQADFDEAEGGGEENTTSCAIEGVGWIVCPITKFIGSLNDALYAVIKQFLQIEASIFNTDGDTYRAWGFMRNIANAMFVIVFLIIIYSQITGGGIGNYGIKKMLPKLVVAAILVNISFWVCAIAVDLSNIIGSGLYGLLQSSIGGTSTNTGLGSPVNSWSDVTVWLLGGGAAALAGTAAVAAVGTYGFFGALSLLIPGAIVALLAFITVVVLLIARQAFIIVLIVISPLAFVAYLLPNTDQWFKRWQKFLTTLLIMYPAVALLFGGAELAAGVIRAADPENAWLVIGSLVVTALPLFALPALMKTAGGLMNRIGGVVNNPNRGPFDRLKKGGEQFQKNQEGRRNRVAMRGGEFFGARRLRKRAEKRAVDQGIQDTSKRSEDQYVANRMTDADGNPTEFAQRVAGATGGRYGVGRQADQADLQQAIANAQLTINEAEIKEARAARIVYEGRGMEAFGAMNELRTNQNLTGAQRTALRSMAVEGGNAQHIEELWNQSAQMEQSERNAFASDLAKHKPAGVGQGRIAEMRTGQGSPEFRDVLAESAASGRYSTQASAGADASELAMLHEVLSDTARMQTAVQGTGQTVDDVKTAVKTAVTTALTDPRFGAGNNRGELTNLSTII